MTDAGMGRPLLAEFQRLNPKQREAVLHDGDLVIRAGPGSGKTRTLVAKVGVLLEREISPFRGLAAITFTGKAAREITHRLSCIGLRPGRRLTAGTLHSWCLQAVLRPYANLAGVPLPARGTVLSETEAKELADWCLANAGIAGPDLYAGNLSAVRRTIALGERIDRLDPRWVKAAHLMDERLDATGLYDYDAMTSRTLRIVRDHQSIAEMVAARHQWLVVDEYQDLGPVLHGIVTTLHDTVGVNIVAVGDPDQTIMGFQGADSRFLDELTNRPGFHEIILDLNYRSGSAIIAAGAAVMRRSTTTRADPERSDPGTIDPVRVQGGLREHAAVVVHKIRELMATGIPAHRIAILYPGRGNLLDLVVADLEESGLPFVRERDRRLPKGPFADFLSRCAARALAGPQPGDSQNSLGRPDIATLGELAHDYQRLRIEGGLSQLPGFQAERLIADSVDASEGAELSELPLADWLLGFAAKLEIESIAKESPERQDNHILSELVQAAADHSLTVSDYAAQDVAIGKVALTTYHSAKGREWDVVILPGLVEGVVPKLRWNPPTRSWIDPAAGNLHQARRAFYVAVTRARDAVIPIHGPGWHSRYSFNQLETSRFLLEILTNLP